MSVRPDITPRYVRGEAPDASEWRRMVETAQQAINTVPLVSFRWVRGYVASGTAGTEMPPVSFGAGDARTLAVDETRGPDVARIDRVVPLSDVTSDVGSVDDRLNFRFESRSDGLHQVYLYEPSGLTANAKYDLVVRFVTGVQG